MTRATWAASLCALVLVSATAALATPTEEAGLNTCQNAVKVATATFVKNKVAAIGTCLQAVSTQMVKNDAVDASGAATTCVTQFRKLNDSRSLGKSLPEKLTAGITAKCTPGGNNTHTLGDILGVGAGVSQPLNAADLNAWCSRYGGDGSIDTLQEWMDCIRAAAECDVDSAIAAQYPRVLDWLVLVKPSMQALTPPATDPNKVTDAVAALDAVKAEIDGPDNDNIVSLQCGGTVSTGTAQVTDVLTGKTFANSTAGGLTGTMPNNGAVNMTPGTSPQTIAAGYHNGSGSVAGDANLVSGNIKSGTSIFGVAGSPLVVDTSGATATAADMVSGKTAYVNGSLVTGSATAGSNVNGPNGAKTFTVPDGLYSGSKTATANDTNLAAGNIKSGVAIFGVTGIFLPATCGNGLIDGTEQCDLGTLNSQTCVTRGFTGGTLRCGAGCVFDTSGCYATRYVDNSNGTITDNHTWLMWEKKVKLDGTQDFANVQDADNDYLWAGTCSVTTSKYCQPTAAASAACAAGVEGDPTGCAQCSGGDGTCSATSTVWTWLVALNTANFAAHSDWRLPKTTELEGLVDYADTSPPVINVAFHGASCGGSCTNINSPACACTQSSYYWSASTLAPFPLYAWYVYFYYGTVNYGTKPNYIYVRAVRSGS